MDFENGLTDNGFFADLFGDNEPLGKFEDASEGSIFNEMVDAIMFEDQAAKAPRDKQEDEKNHSVEGNSDENDQNGNDDCILFKFPAGELGQPEVSSQSCNKTASTQSPAKEGDGIMDISKDDQKLVDTPENDFKEVIKIQIEEEEDNLTEMDPSEVLEVTKKLKQLKRPRRDVTYKTILRKCRKYYQLEFNETTGYLKRKKKEPCSFYKNCILKYLEESFKFETHLDVSFHLGALLYPQEMIRGIESFVYPEGVKTFTPKKVVKRKLETHRQQVDKLHSILYKFTHEKLDKFIAVPELAAIFLNYIQNGAGSDVEDKEFKYEFIDLTKRCTKTLSRCKKVKGVATLFD